MGRLLAVPASSLIAGDTVLTQSGDLGAITKMENVTRRGIFAPFTMSGTIVVDGIVASSYVSLQEQGDGQLSHKLMLGGFEVPLTMQWMAHVVQAPHRLLCRLYWSFCQEETYTASGLSWWSASTYWFAQWLLHDGGTWVILIAAPLFLILLVFCIGRGCAKHRRSLQCWSSSCGHILFQ